MTPEEEERLVRAYFEMMMGGGDPDLAMQFGPAPGKSANTNNFQDRFQILGDPLTSAMGGLGAFDAGAFDPTPRRNSVEAPGLRAYRKWESSPAGSVRGEMLRMIDEDENTPEQAYRNLLTVIEGNPGGALAAQLPPVMDRDGTFSTDAQAGLFSIYEEYNDVREAMASDPAGVQYDNQTGGYYTTEMVPSKMATKFKDEYMLPLPTESYMDPYRSRDGMQAAASELEGEAMARQMAQLGRRQYAPPRGGAHMAVVPPEPDFDISASRPLGDLIPFGVSNFKSLVDNARGALGGAFGSSGEGGGEPEYAPGPQQSYDSYASEIAALGNFGGPRGGSPMNVDPYDPLSGEDYEREKQRIEDVFAARRALEEEGNQPGGSPFQPGVVTAPGARVDESNTSIGGLNFNTFGMDGPTTKTNSGLLKDQILRSSELYDDSFGVTEGKLDKLVWNPEMGRYVLASNGLPNSRNTSDYLGAITPDRAGTATPSRPTPSLVKGLPSATGLPSALTPTPDPAPAPARQRYSQERRDLQAQMNQGVRDRFKRNSGPLADQYADDFYRASAMQRDGRTPMMDAMRQRMAIQQLAGF